MGINELWELDPTEFNKWRRKNDLLALFDNFKSTLPLFNEWLHENLLAVDKILETDQPGKFFYYENEVCVVYSPASGFFPFCFYEVSNEKEKKRLLGTEKNNFSYLPYLFWVKKKLGTQNVIPTRLSGHLDTFRYQYNPANAILCTGIVVLKMGSVEINGWANFILRNLDFCDLDFLTVTSGLELSRKTEVFYSTFRNMTIVNSEGNFKHFFQCHFSELKCSNARLYGFDFFNCELYRLHIKDTALTSFIFFKSYLSLLNFESAKVADIYYIPPSKPWGSGIEDLYESISNNFKSLRVLFQSNGLRKEASDAYYSERLYEMKSSIKKSKVIKSISDFDFRHPLASTKNITSKFILLSKSLSNGISYAIWGFGERAHRIVLSSLIVICDYAAYYFFSDISKTHGNSVNSLYLSIVTFTTLGYGDISPADSTSITKLLVSTEALAGAFFMGLFVAGFSNKSRY